MLKGESALIFDRYTTDGEMKCCALFFFTHLGPITKKTGFLKRFPKNNWG